MQKINDLLQGFLCFILTGHILEGNAGLLFHVDLGFAAAETAHHTFTAEPLGKHPHGSKDQGEHDGIVQDHHNGGIVFHDQLTDGDPHVL